MPMFKALSLCPHATIVRPDMAKYAKAGRTIRTMMGELTPLVQPVSIDEAFLDLSGTQALHGASPAVTLARFAARIEREIGITVSVGLSHNKFLAKLASDADKPARLHSHRPRRRRLRAATAAGRRDLGCRCRLAGAPRRARLRHDRRHPGLHGGRVRPPHRLRRLLALGGSRGDSTAARSDPSARPRACRPRPPSATTWRPADDLEPILFHLCEKVALRLATGDVAAGGVVLKLKDARLPPAHPLARADPRRRSSPPASSRPAAPCSPRRSTAPASG